MRCAHDTITIWNKWRNPETNKDQWFRHVIHNCVWEHKTVRAVSGQTASVASTFSVLISENPRFRSQNDWAAGNKASFFTLQAGDLVALNKQTLEITGIAPSTESAIRQSLSPEVFTIRAFNNNTASYKLGKHYYVEGV